MADLPAAGATSFTRQQAPLGLGHAVWCAREIVGDEPFAVLLPDMITMAVGTRPLPRAMRRRPMKNMAAISSRSRKCRRKKRINMASSAIGKDFGHDLRDHRHGRKAAEGNGALQSHHFGPLYSGPEIFHLLEKGEKGRGRRNPAHRWHDRSSPRRQNFHGVRFDGKTYDCGAKLGFLAANIAFGLANPGFGTLAPG